jgi:hypothetical protein
MSKAKRVLSLIQNRIGGVLKETKKGTPYLLVDDYWSICYFGRTKILRMFRGFASRENNRYEDFKQWEDVVSHFKKIKPHLNYIPMTHHSFTNKQQYKNGGRNDRRTPRVCLG